MINLISNKILNLMMNFSSSAFSKINLISASVNLNFPSSKIISFLLRILYFVCKWILYIVDVMFFYIRQISGLNIDTSSLGAMANPDSDLIFGMIGANYAVISRIVRQLIGLTIVVLIICTIIAIIKSNLSSKNEGSNNNIRAIKSAFKSILLIAITPLIFVGGIIMSNIILKSLYNAMNITDSSSLSSSIFALSSPSANQFRIYAQQGDRIPIYYEFSQEEEYMNQIEKQNLTETAIDYLTSKNNPAYQTHLMFEDESYYKFKDLNENLGNSKYNEYYNYFDRPNSSKSGIKIVASQEQYLVMADFIDYAVKTQETFYLKTVDEVVDSLKIVPSPNSAYGYANMYDYLDYEGVYFDTQTYNDRIQMRVNYYEYDEETMSTGPTKQVLYEHKRGALDELYGAIYLIVIEKNIEVSGLSYSYYEPVVSGYRKNGNSAPFNSEYLKGDGNLVVAKGLFTEDGLPTAIKREKGSGEIIFYRDNLKEYDLGNIPGVLTFYMKEEDGGGFFDGIVKFFKKLFNPSSLIPTLDINQDAVRITYKKQTEEVVRFEYGKIHLSYLFRTTNGFNINNLYRVEELNFLLLAMGSALLLKVFFTAIFALIKRVYDMFLLYIFYPTACATMPLDDGVGYKKWLTTFVGKLFSVYGLLLGINFVFMLIPVVENITFFTEADVASSVYVRRLCILISRSNMAKYLNLLTSVFFELVAMSLLVNGGIIKIFSKLFPGQEDLTTDNTANAIGETLAKSISFPSKLLLPITTVINPNKRKDFLKKLKKGLIDTVPFSNTVIAAKDMGYLHKKKEEYKNAKKDLEEVLHTNSADKKEVEKKMNDFLNAQKKYADSFHDTTGKRKTEEDRIKVKEAKNLFGNARTLEDFSNNSSTTQYLDMFDGMSDNEISKGIEKAEKFVKKNRSKYDIGKLDENDREKYEEYDKFLAHADGVLKDRASRTKRITEIKTRTNILEAKKLSGTLTASEQIELNNLKAEKNNIDFQLKKESKAYDIAHKMRARKKSEKEKHQRDNDEHLFRHRIDGFGQRKYLRMQNIRLNQLDEDVDESLNMLTSEGLNGYQTKSIAEIEAELSNPNSTLTGSQREALEAYCEARKYKADMEAINDNEYRSYAKVSGRPKIENDESLLRRKGFFAQRKIDKHDTQNNSDLSQLQAQRASVQSQIDDIDLGVNTASYSERQKLIKKREVIDQEIERIQLWHQNNNVAGRQKLRDDAKKEKKQKKLDKKFIEYAIEYYESRGEDITDEKIENYIANARASMAKKHKNKNHP